MPTFGFDVPTVDGLTKNDICTSGSLSMVEIGKPLEAGESMSGFITGCGENSTCNVKVKAPALAVSDCYSRVVDLDLNQGWKQTTTFTNSTLILSRTLFLSYLGLLIDDESNEESLNLVVGSACDNDSCNGNLNLTACTLKSAIGSYEVLIEGGAISLPSPGTAEILDLANNTAVKERDPSGQPSTLAGVSDLILGQYIGDYQVISTTPLQSFTTGQYIAYEKTERTRDYPEFDNPLKDILGLINEIMFRTGVHAAANVEVSDLKERMDPGLDAPSHVLGTRTGVHNVFQTDYRFFIGAAVVEIFCIVCILPTYWGWWRSSRRVSFSPLELGKAFDAPVLADCDPNLSGRQVANTFGDRPIRYDSTRSTFVLRHNSESEESLERVQVKV
jgi:hypothetical protein